MERISALSDWLRQHCSVTKLIVLLVVSTGFLWAFNFSSLPLSSPAMEKITGSVGLLDAMLHYSPHQAIHAMALYGDDGRALYVNFLIADFIFIPLYCTALACWITSLTSEICKPPCRWSWLNVLPYAIALFDLTENIAVASMLAAYPEPHMAAAVIASIATPAKYFLIFVCFGIVVYGLVTKLLLHFGVKLGN